MSEIIAENPQFASYSTLSRVLRDRALQAARAFQAQVRRFDLGLMEQEEDEECGIGILDSTYEEQEEYYSQHEREAWERGQDIQRGCEIMRAHTAARRRDRVRVRPHHNTAARVRARRSPASQRRATTDSGGSDSDGGDPEPPRPRSSSLSPVSCGGAL